MVKVLEKVNDEWWWVELNGGLGYVPSNHLMDAQAAGEETIWQDEEYFESYGTLKLHYEMLNDQPRTLAYRTAIERAKPFIHSRTVLDVGCGTAILSLFCASLGGAGRVVAVEASEMAEHASRLVERNQLAGVVQVLRGRVEEVALEGKVDLIVSEWMGTLLLFEFMVESVLIARDRWLKDDGVIWPSEAELFLVPCSAEKYHREKIDFWSNVYGFDFTPLVPLTKSELYSRPVHDHVLSPQDCLAAPCSVLRLNLKSLKLADIEKVESSFQFVFSKQGVVHGFGSWFETKFGGIPPDYSYEDVTLSTSPWQPLTHWKQDLLLLDDPLAVSEGDRLDGVITLTRNPLWRRHLRVRLTFSLTTSDDSSQDFCKEFRLWR